MQNDKTSNHDLEHIYTHTKDLWYDLDGKKIFITGGTGFFGIWLLKTIIYVNEKKGVNIEALVLSRDPKIFQKSFPHISNKKEISFHVGDIRSFEFPRGSFQYIIHCASTSNKEKYLGTHPVERYQVTADGAKHVLDYAVKCNVNNVLLISSGSVYGFDLDINNKIDESSLNAPSTIDIKSDTCYAEAKRVTEMLGTIYSKEYGIKVKIARCFTFIGPYFPLEYHFAIGNFINAALNGGPMIVNGNGTEIRSYMYSSDLMIWLWSILLKGKSCYPYNVGSEEGISIGNLVKLIAKLFDPHRKIIIKNEHPIVKNKPDIYIPSTNRAKVELGLTQTINLELAIKKTLSFYNN